MLTRVVRIHTRSLQTQYAMPVLIKNVLISDEVDPKCVDILKQNGIDVVKNTKLSKQQLIDEIKNYDGLIVRSATKVTSEILDAATNLKIIGRAGTGVDNIDTKTATKKGVIVMNTPGGNTISAAEHTCAMILALSRHIPQGHTSMQAGKWDRKKYMGNEVQGKTLAIIGLGRIGKEVALRMQSFGMRTIGFDPIIPGEVSAEFGVQWLPLEEIWPQADYVTVHTPLIPQTRNLIGKEVFSKCKKGLRVVNVARGGIIDEDALIPALDAGQCGGAALDVFIEEPPTNQKLVQHPLVVSTPHLGASTAEAQSRVAEEIAQQFVDTVNGKSLFGAINAPAMSNALSPASKPWVAVGNGLGVLATAMVGAADNTTEVTIKSFGPELVKANSYLGAAVCAGLLKTSGCEMNLINAPVFAKELGVKLTMHHNSQPENGRSNYVTVVVNKGGAASCKLSGCAAGDNALLVEVNGAKFPNGVPLVGDLLVYKSASDPKVMPAVASALAGEDVNALTYAASLPIDDNGEMWNAMTLSRKLRDTDILKLRVNSVHQLSFSS
ncbi:D-3-phosphoglycerate dehydrogenase-like [Tubulanus polymorphus]|uniref:D-3-phosphoglycerate dehydrogenase-like n=1 Tax=Tubulanus polymorphus TaxID=672921 RepID=UPI003DA692C9